MSFLERGGVQIMLALIAVSIFLAVRIKPQRGRLRPDGPHAPVGLGPQLCFLAVVTACALYVIYESFGFTFLGGVFPLSVVADHSRAAGRPGRGFPAQEESAVLHLLRQRARNAG